MTDLRTPLDSHDRHDMRAGSEVERECIECGEVFVGEITAELCPSCEEFAERREECGCTRPSDASVWVGVLLK